MSPTPTACRATPSLLVLGTLMAGVLLFIAERPAPAATASRSIPVRITGGHATDPRDGGRPVVLVAAALGVPTAVFREAFSHVTPAAAGEEPDPAQVQRNKAALLAVLAPYGVTNATLDAASDHYRFDGAGGGTWPQTAARARGTIRHGRVVAVRLLSGGSGYSSTPRVTVPGHPAATFTVTVRYGTDTATSGAIGRLALTR